MTRLEYIDALVCCHAAPIGASFEQQIAVDLIGAYNACMAVLPGMVARQWGRIVLLGSIRAQHPRPAGQMAYAAAKSSVEGLARAIAVEYGCDGITCNVVAPGAVLTPRTSANIAAGTVSENELVGRTPAGRLCTPADVAALVVWLLSDSAAMVNGETIHVDGGWSVSG
jgi:NAD(P)-dependent dehydrogenase (short-subunit alcohol dehydrogenase family)